jgi:DNA-binding NtrC family response regulator
VGFDLFSPQNIDLLIVDDDDEFRATLARRFTRRGFCVHQTAAPAEALDLAERRAFDVALVDLVMPEMSGVELLVKLKRSQPECEVIMLTGQGTIEAAVEAMKQGAFDFLTKPFPLAELELRIQRACERRLLSKENRQLKELTARGQAASEMIGESPVMKEIERLIQRAGPTERAILIQGASGTGKELVARALHRASPRADKPLVVINCAALPETLLESELFGHEKGAFTGAVVSKMGLFEMADGGTLLIDEIGEMPGSLQAKLLRVLEDGSMRRVGSLKEVRVDVRLLAATNRNLAQEVQAGRFREDLFYRINVLSLQLPPLCEREGDVRLLMARFLGPGWEIDDEALAALERYDWPGNVRQLYNVIERGKILADDQRIRLRDLPTEVALGRSSESEDASNLTEIERVHIYEVLRRERGNKARAARALGVSRRTLYRFLSKYGEELAAGQAGLGARTRLAKDARPKKTSLTRERKPKNA